ncbi:MAG: flagellar basal body rod protein FlgB [Candidimonas sp.]|nr:MAG: flagellar basal body rod protein FlgB [Candidimonas sp.]
MTTVLSGSPLDRAFSFYETAINVRRQRLELLSTNIANADTPEYKARDIDFTSSLRQALSARQNLPPVALELTDPRHIPGTGPAFAAVDAQYRVPFQQSADGNTVEMDTERVDFADTVMHYQADLAFVSDRIKTMLAALQST